jgi:hypothetical protein
MKKKRGAQPGNNNALQHGLYSAAFKAEENRLLGESSATDLTAEIELIRVMNTRFLESLQISQPLDPETQMSALRAVSLSTQTIMGLIRLQSQRTVANKEMDDILRHIASIPVDDLDEDEPADNKV